mgnify:CR=1 FL=1
MRILYLPNSYSQQRQHEKPANIYPVRMAMEAEWHRQHGCYVQWGGVPFEEYGPWDKVIYEPEGMRFLELPRPDRVFTRAKEYDSGNYKYRPGTHIMSASGCWWGKCSFCVENKQPKTRYCPQWQMQCKANTCSELSLYHPIEKCIEFNKSVSPYEVRQVEDVISEIEECKALGFREIFDDSATFPTGRWLDEFIKGVTHRGITWGCNMRIVDMDYKRLKVSGCRLVLFGIESANRQTLEKINKGVKSEDIIPTLKKASKCGLDCHGAFMFGYPWETEEDARRTLKLCHYLLCKGYLKTAQASLYSPQGVPGNQAHKKYVNKIYNAGFYPEFWWRKIMGLHSKEDLTYLTRGIKAWYESVITKQQ